MMHWSCLRSIAQSYNGWCVTCVQGVEQLSHKIQGLVHSDEWRLTADDTESSIQIRRPARTPQNEGLGRHVMQLPSDHCKFGLHSSLACRCSKALLMCCHYNKALGIE